MTDGTAGWFRDPNDPALARWHDGDRWTEHTLTIADQAPGSEPPPPVTAAVPVTSTFEAAGAYGVATEGGSLASKTRSLPPWAKVVAPLVVIALIAVAFLLSSGDDEPSTTETAGTENATLDDAVDAARRAGLADEISDSRAAALIERICDAAEDPSEVDELGEDLAALPAATTTELRQQISALGEGAERRCPSALDDEPDLIDDLQDQAAVAFSTTTTAPTILPDGTGATVPGGEGTDGGTGGSTTKTTKKSTGGTGGTTATTVRPTTTPTLPVRGLGDSCSSEGSKAVTASGRSLTCVRTNCVSSPPKYAYAFSPKTCPTPPTTPPTDPNAPPPTLPSTTTTVDGGGP
jgi:hypothetical protein